MPNTSVRVAAEGMPEINRRRLLLGLAAASTAAAIGTTAEAAKPALTENPDLIRLAAELPALSAECVSAINIQHEIERRWNSATPWAPDELTEHGTAWPHDAPYQPGNAEKRLLGSYLLRKGEKYPRRIVVTAQGIEWKISRATRNLRKANKRTGNVADYMAVEEEISHLRTLLAAATDYETRLAELEAPANREYEAAWPITNALVEKLELHVANIMEADDWTIEGLLIKAEALAEWDRVASMRGAPGWKIPVKHGLGWHGQIAASILRHAKGGAA